MTKTTKFKPGDKVIVRYTPVHDSRAGETPGFPQEMQKYIGRTFKLRTKWTVRDHGDCWFLEEDTGYVFMEDWLVLATNSVKKELSHEV